MIMNKEDRKEMLSVMIIDNGKFAEIGGNVDPAVYISKPKYDCKIFQALSVKVDKSESFLGNHFVVNIIVLFPKRLLGQFASIFRKKRKQFAEVEMLP